MHSRGKPGQPTAVPVEAFDIEDPETLAWFISHRHIIKEISRQFAYACGSRGAGTASFYIALWRFIGRGPLNGEIAAYYGVILSWMNVLRELFKAILNETKKAAGDVEQLRHAFRVAMAVMTVPIIGSFVGMEAYVLLLPFLGCTKEVCDIMFNFPVQSIYNLIALMLLSSVMTYANGRDHVGALMGIMILASVVMAGSYELLSMLGDSLSYLVLANFLQLSMTNIGYPLYLQLKHGDEKLLQSLFSLKDISKVFKDALMINWRGVGPALIAFSDTLALAGVVNLLPAESMREYQLLMTVIAIFSGIGMVCSDRLTSMAIGAKKLLINEAEIKKPDELQKAWHRYLMHGAWIGNILLVMGAVVGNAVGSQSVKILDWNIALAIGGLRTLSYMGRGIVFSERTSNTPLHEAMNNLSAASFVAGNLGVIPIGSAIDSTLQLRGTSYLLGMLISQLAAAGAQVSTARSLIDQEAERLRIEQNGEPAKPLSPLLSFWQSPSVFFRSSCNRSSAQYTSVPVAPPTEDAPPMLGQLGAQPSWFMSWRSNPALVKKAVLQKSESVIPVESVIPAKAGIHPY